MTLPPHIDAFADELERRHDERITDMTQEQEPKQEIMRAHEAAQAPLPSGPVLLTPLQMIDNAVANGASVEVLERLMALQERHEANQARKAFDQALAAAKAKIKPVVKTRAGHNYKYEDLAQIAAAVDPVLAEYGLSYTFETDCNGVVKVTCIISHKDGHCRTTSLSADPDTSGSKNKIQAIGSAVTYLQRYTLKAALGLAAAADDDARAVSDAGGEKVSAEERDQLVALADLVGADKAKFCAYMKVPSLADIPASQFQRAMHALEAKPKKAS